MGWWHFTKFWLSVVKQVGADDLSGRAAEMAYKFFLALFPFMIFLAATGAFVAKMVGVANPADELMEQIGPSLPADAASLLRTQIENITENPSTGLLSVGILGTIWAASSGIGTVMKALNQVFDVEEKRPLPKRYGTAVGLTIVAGLFVMASVTLMVVGQAFGTELAEQVGFQGAAATAVVLARFILVILLLLLAVAFVFWAAPAVDLPFRWISPGAVTFVVLWLPFTYLFGLYVSNFGSYNATYGALGGVVVLLVWIYLSSFIFLFSAEVNAVLAQRAIERAERDEASPEGLIARLRNKLPFIGDASPQPR